MSNLHPLARRAAGAAVALALGAACSGGGQKADGTTVPSADDPSTTTTAPVEVEVSLGRSLVVGPGAPPDDAPELPAATTQAVLDTVDAYVTTALVGPLQGNDADLDGLARPGAAARLAPGEHDRAVLTTEGLPSAAATSATLEPVNLVGLTEGFGSLPLVSASVDFAVTLDTDDGPLDVRHTGEIVLREVADGWKIVGYEMIVVRDDHSAAGPTTTSATATEETS
jgi:hypothetical protein